MSRQVKGRACMARLGISIRTSKVASLNTSSCASPSSLRYATTLDLLTEQTGAAIAGGVMLKDYWCGDYPMGMRDQDDDKSP
ncbi:hypothetical protein RRG08_005681 [Elysia crispata]|uniref:Uncharacterized protein n=1 Tax=Elysia crispata TaxID=231223 RepID=A0AAE1CW93_9GAST|nr:hypothetical protein RRG08_005681 [Elysia crispata]